MAAAGGGGGRALLPPDLGMATAKPQESTSWPNAREQPRAWAPKAGPPAAEVHARGGGAASPSSLGQRPGERWRLSLRPGVPED